MLLTAACPYAITTITIAVKTYRSRSIPHIQLSRRAKTLADSGEAMGWGTGGGLPARVGAAGRSLLGSRRAPCPAPTAGRSTAVKRDTLHYGSRHG